MKTHDFLIKAEGLVTAKHGRFVVCWGCCGGLVRACKDRQDDIRVSGGLDDAVALVRDSLNRGSVSGELWVQLMIMGTSAIDARGTGGGRVWVVVAPQLQSWFTVGDLMAAQRASCTVAFVGCG